MPNSPALFTIMIPSLYIGIKRKDKAIDQHPKDAEQ